MDLFVINRNSEDKLPSNVSNEDQEKKLKKVLAQIEKRRVAKQKALTKIATDRQLLEEPEQRHSDFNNLIQPLQVEEIAKITPVLKRTKKVILPLQIEGFTILGETNKTQKTTVKRVLPKWLSNPTVIRNSLQDLSLKVSKLKLLDKEIRKKLKSNGIKYFFPVQAEVIPWLLKVQEQKSVMIPNDICVSAPTGSGKTLSFVLPIIQTLQCHFIRRIRALIILPTQDLASQVYNAFKQYSNGTKLETGLATAKNSYELEKNQIIYRDSTFGFVSKIDILVCTAGRLVQHLKATEGFNLQLLEYIVIDEADRVLDNVQDDWLYHLEKHIYQNEPPSGNFLNVYALYKKRLPQKLLFSATLSQDPEKLQKLTLFQPKLFTCVDTTAKKNENESSFAGKFTTPAELTEKFIICSKQLKPLVLYKFLKREKLRKTIVFTHSIESAHRLSILLRFLFKGKREVQEISSSLKGTSRDELIRDFGTNKIDFLICTDSLTRGIDFPSVQCVISYSVPKYPKTYIHRSGRTARAGQMGTAVTFVHQGQMGQFNHLLQQMNKSHLEEIQIDESELKKLGEKYDKSLNELKLTIEGEENADLKKMQANKKLRIKKKQRK